MQTHGCNTRHTDCCPSQEVGQCVGALQTLHGKGNFRNHFGDRENEQQFQQKQGTVHLKQSRCRCSISVEQLNWRGSRQSACRVCVQVRRGVRDPSAPRASWWSRRATQHSPTSSTKLLGTLFTLASTSPENIIAMARAHDWSPMTRMYSFPSLACSCGCGWLGEEPEGVEGHHRASSTAICKRYPSGRCTAVSSAPPGKLSLVNCRTARDKSDAISIERGWANRHCTFAVAFPASKTISHPQVMIDPSKKKGAENIFNLLFS